MRQFGQFDAELFKASIDKLSQKIITLVLESDFAHWCIATIIACNARYVILGLQFSMKCFSHNV